MGERFYHIIASIFIPNCLSFAGVSAVSQVISFVRKKKHSNMSSPQKLLQEFNAYCLSQGNNRLVAYECVRVPRKFNARSSATWRRYLYLFPLNHPQEVDISFINDALNRICGQTLRFDAFCRGEKRNIGDGLQDHCTIYHAKASIQLLFSANDKSPYHGLCLEFVGSRFLRNMVRILSVSYWLLYTT